MRWRCLARQALHSLPARAPWRRWPPRASGFYCSGNGVMAAGITPRPVRSFSASRWRLAGLPGPARLVLNDRRRRGYLVGLLRVRLGLRDLRIGCGATRGAAPAASHFGSRSLLLKGSRQRVVRCPSAPRFHRARNHPISLPRMSKRVCDTGTARNLLKARQE